LLAIVTVELYNVYINIKYVHDILTSDHEAFVALGGNQGDVRAAFQEAVAQLVEKPVGFAGKKPIISLVAKSSIYRTIAVGGPTGQPDYLNAVIRIETTLEPRELLERCLDVERQLGRSRRERWGPRQIDLDLLLYDDSVIDEPGLSVPHPRLRSRLFVLAPLAGVAPDGFALPPDGMLLAEIVERELRAAGDNPGVSKTALNF